MFFCNDYTFNNFGRTLTMLTDYTGKNWHAIWCKYFNACRQQQI